MAISLGIWRKSELKHLTRTSWSCWTSDSYDCASESQSGLLGDAHKKLPAGAWLVLGGAEGAGSEPDRGIRL